MYLWHACDVFLALLGLPGVFSRPDSVVRTIILSKWQFWGQGLNFNAPGEDPTPLSGVRTTQWLGFKASAAANRGTVTQWGLTPLSFSCTVCGRGGLELHPAASLPTAATSGRETMQPR